MANGTISRLGLAALVATFAAGCGKSEPADQSAPPAAVQPTPAPTPARPAAAPAPARPPAQKLAPAVPFEQLVALIPEMEGWTRSTPRGEQITIGVPTSRAVAQYDSDESSIDLEIVDSSLNEYILAPMTMFLDSKYAERSSEGYRKAAPVRGFPGFEDWNDNARRAEVTVVAGNRFIVRATGHNVANPKAVRALVQSVDLARLAALK